MSPPPRDDEPEDGFLGNPETVEFRSGWEPSPSEFYDPRRIGPRLQDAVRHELLGRAIESQTGDSEGVLVHEFKWPWPSYDLNLKVKVDWLYRDSKTAEVVSVSVLEIPLEDSDIEVPPDTPPTGLS